MKLNLKKIRYSLNNIKTSRSNNVPSSVNPESPTKDSQIRKGDLDICIEPQSKVINPKGKEALRTGNPNTDKHKVRKISLNK